MRETHHRTPNERLRELVRESDWSYESVARAVNALGALSGLGLRYDRTTVAHWVRGSCPRPPVPELVAEVLSRRLGRTVTVQGTGLGSAAVLGAAGAGARDPLAGLGELRQAHLDPVLRESMRRILLPEEWPSPDWADDNGAGGVHCRGPAQRRSAGSAPWRIGASEVDAMEAVGLLYKEARDAFGGGLGTSSLAAFLADNVAVWLRSPLADGVRVVLMSRAAELTQRLALMHFEDGDYGFAQRYMSTAAQLARAAGDRTMYVTALARMATLARELGHYRKAAHLADAGQVLLSGCAADTVSFAQGKFAMAYTAVGDVWAARRCLDAAERILPHCTGSPSLSAWRLALYYVQQAHFLACYGSPGEALPQLRASLRHVPEANRRFRVAVLLCMADVQLRMGRAEEACATLRQLLADFSRLRSADLAGFLNELLRRVCTFRRVGPAIDLLEQTQGLLPLGGRPAAVRPYFF